REVLGIFLTHGHEDHIGGLPFALKKLNVPVFGTRLTLGLLKPKLKEHRILRESDLREVRVGDSVQLRPFRRVTVPCHHSVPDAVALAIDTPVGRLVYTRDFKLDPAPPDGLPTDLARFRRLGDEGVLLLLSDSTNAEREGRSGSERDLHAPFEKIFTDAPARIVVANFASNIHRIQHLVRMAAQFGRRVAVVGRSLRENFRTARELGFLSVPDGVTVPLADVDRIPPSKLLLLTAGSQGEPMSALTRFAAQRHPFLNVRKDDWVVISARPIPGNERMVHQTVNNLYRHGARVFYSEVGNVHVTGHAQRGELREMLDRRHLAEDGILVVTLTLDRDTGALRAGPDLISRGVIEPELSTTLMADARAAVLDSIKRFSNSHPELAFLQEAIHDAVSKTIYKQTRRRPMVIPVVTEI